MSHSWLCNISPSPTTDRTSWKKGHKLGAMQEEVQGNMWGYCTSTYATGPCPPVVHVYQLHSLCRSVRGTHAAHVWGGRSIHADSGVGGVKEKSDRHRQVWERESWAEPGRNGPGAGPASGGAGTFGSGTGGSNWWGSCVGGWASSGSGWGSGTGTGLLRESAWGVPDCSSGFALASGEVGWTAGGVAAAAEGGGGEARAASACCGVRGKEVTDSTSYTTSSYDHQIILNQVNW